ncbi:hypothetical protein, partial [Okeania sp. SIO2B9]
MLLRKVVSAILTDFVGAQDLSNEYASQISRKYKQYRNGKENILNNFESPVSLLKEIDLELKFTIIDIDEISSDALDIEESWGNCRNIADEVIKPVIREMQALIGTILQDIPGLVSSDDQIRSTLLETDAPEDRQNTRVQNLQNLWSSIRNNLDN